MHGPLPSPYRIDKVDLRRSSILSKKSASIRMPLLFRTLQRRLFQFPCPGYAFQSFQMRIDPDHTM